MLRSQTFKSYFSASAAFKSQHHLVLAQTLRTYSARSGSDSQATEFEAARHWFQNFDQSAIAELGKLSKTDFSRSSGPGGQKVNKTSSKATTVWSMGDLLRHVPKVFHSSLRTNRYYAPASDSISIQCDTNRNRIDNKNETYQRLAQEITRIYKSEVPGVTSEEQKQRVIELQKAASNNRLKMKKKHSDKKQSRVTRDWD
ncbi:Uncharacterized protein BP5553_09283 [Venustampulla echinocandica]|uniref:Prokaryotic-type class I peptide chain release factors domain-containing protein n=1 Tax=Venustampulla echinocandica TaxID=2656787 RepID=A0A370TCB1_9HELO|nr:Uncharacterized protein BP5553_09283 [Venustampulla echinocandica]RDL31881.1 Uncharacterized protein BP5553_09283 [Venustampulla echinocandica]